MDYIFDYITRKKVRVVDAHVGILGAHLFVKMLAPYGATFHILGISTMKWFYFSLLYHKRSTYYPKYTIEIQLFGKKLIDTGKEAKLLTAASVDKYMRESDEKKEAESKRVLEMEKRISELEKEASND